MLRMLYKLVFQEQREDMKTDGSKFEYMHTINEVTSYDPSVMAATLRAIADKLDPPKKLLTR